MRWLATYQSSRRVRKRLRSRLEKEVRVAKAGSSMGEGLTAGSEVHARLADFGGFCRRALVALRLGEGGGDDCGDEEDEGETGGWELEEG